MGLRVRATAESVFGVNPLPDRATVNLAKETRRLLTHGGRETLSAAIRRLVRDSLTLFEMPQPARRVLEQDMESLGVMSHRDYIVWLLMERHRQLGVGGAPR